MELAYYTAGGAAGYGAYGGPSLYPYAGYGWGRGGSGWYGGIGIGF